MFKQIYNVRERSQFIEQLFTFAFVIRGRYLPDFEFGVFDIIKVTLK